jgi:hypothetical protein
MGHWSNNSDREKQKYSKKNLPQCHFTHQKSYAAGPGIEPGSPSQLVQECDAIVTHRMNDIQCLPDEDVLTLRLAVNSN